MAGFYPGRKNHKYYTQVKKWLESYGPRDSILDIGSADTPVASWGSFQHRYLMEANPKWLPDFPGVIAINGRWPEDAGLVPDRVEVVTCLQVLEHVIDVQPFVDAIFAAATHRVILSVPYKWPAGTCDTHIHDPIDRDKLRAWTRRKPTRSQVVADSGRDRLVEEYAP